MQWWSSCLPAASLVLRGASTCLGAGQSPPSLVLITWGKALSLLTPLQDLLPASHLTSWRLVSSPYLLLFHISLLSFLFLFLAFCWCLSHQPSNLEELMANPLWCWILQSSKYYYAMSNVRENISKERSILKLSIESSFSEKMFSLYLFSLNCVGKRWQVQDGTSSQFSFLCYQWLTTTKVRLAGSLTKGTYHGLCSWWKRVMSTNFSTPLKTKWASEAIM